MRQLSELRGGGRGLSSPPKCHFKQGHGTGSSLLTGYRHPGGAGERLRVPVCVCAAVEASLSQEKPWVLSQLRLTRTPRSLADQDRWLCPSDHQLCLPTASVLLLNVTSRFGFFPIPSGQMELGDTCNSLSCLGSLALAGWEGGAPGFCQALPNTFPAGGGADTLSLSCESAPLSGHSKETLCAQSCI